LTSVELSFSFPTVSRAAVPFRSPLIISCYWATLIGALLELLAMTPDLTSQVICWKCVSVTSLCGEKLNGSAWLYHRGKTDTHTHGHGRCICGHIIPTLWDLELNQLK
jgi:hypothetical protein